MQAGFAVAGDLTEGVAAELSPDLTRSHSAMDYRHSGHLPIMTG